MKVELRLNYMFEYGHEKWRVKSIVTLNFIGVIRDYNDKKHFVLKYNENITNKYHYLLKKNYNDSQDEL